MRLELLYGMAGLVGSLVSGHLYPLLSSSLGKGTLLLGASMVLHVLGLLQAVFLLRVSVSTLCTCVWITSNMEGGHFIVANNELCASILKDTPLFLAMSDFSVSNRKIASSPPPRPLSSVC